MILDGLIILISEKYDCIGTDVFSFIHYAKILFRLRNFYSIKSDPALEDKILLILYRFGAILIQMRI